MKRTMIKMRNIKEIESELIKRYTWMDYMDFKYGVIEKKKPKTSPERKKLMNYWLPYFLEYKGDKKIEYEIYRKNNIREKDFIENFNKFYNLKLRTEKIQKIKNKLKENGNG
jgi:hypothetical protein